MATEDAATGNPRDSDDVQKHILTDVGEKILSGLDAVAQAAREALSAPTIGVSPTTLIRPSNMMVGEAAPERFIHAKSTEERANLRRLIEEPFIARVEVYWGPDHKTRKQTLYFPRRSAVGVRVGDGMFVSSYAPLGRLAEYEAGETAYIFVGGREREARILRRAVFSPRRLKGQWDARVGYFEADPWGDLLDLLRGEWLRQALANFREEPADADVEDLVGRLREEEASAVSERLRLRRKVVDRIALRDQPILNKFQGEIFRLPLDRQVILLGPPGSGKTTTLIKRLAQKRTPEALTEEEGRLLSDYTRDTFSRSDSWAMFSPAELLKQYLGDAFNQEGVPDAGNVRTWDKERHDLTRNVFNILRSNNSGRFLLEDNPDLLIDPSSPGIARLHDGFAAYADVNHLKRCNQAVANLLTNNDERIKRLALKFQTTLGPTKQIAVEDVLRLFGQTDDLQTEVKRISDHISTELNRLVNQLLGRHRTLLQEIMLALPTIRADETADEDDEEDAEEAPPVAPLNPRIQALNMLMNAFRNRARAIIDDRRTIGGQSGRMVELIGDRMPPDSQFVSIGANIATRTQLNTLVRSARAYVLGMPGMYARFRRESLREGRYFVQGEATTVFLNRNRITRDELDVLLLVMLSHARRLFQHDRTRLRTTTQHDWLETIKSRYLMQVFVDEATDLSAAQLACTVELAHPQLRSWFASGDLRQRITLNGLQHESEFSWLSRVTDINVDTRRIDIGYRQSHRLRELSDALAAVVDPASQVKTNSPRGSEEADIPPLLKENLVDAELAEWLAQRTHEVERAIGRLPSIAVFVDGDDLIDPLHNATQKLLAERSIQIVGCKEGRVVGDASEVRIFDIQHIKGLEFEAVFFIGIDRLAERIPNLFHRFLYVGVTRAATYLGLTFEGSLPKQLEPLRSHFAADGW